MTALDGWLEEATCQLAKDSAARVRSEIPEHYELALETARCQGATAGEAERLALAALGDAGIANQQYRQVLLTSAEARMLREGEWEARAVCSRSWLSGLFSILPLVALCAAATLFFKGATAFAWVLLAGGLTLALVLTAPLLPIYTPARGRIFRWAKWSFLLGTLVLALGWSWVLFVCLWPLAWAEWTRMSIRRKIPATEWPKQLYL